ncbi:MAG: restriction endonuclease subunit S [Bacteroidales bacterium]|nr:restriction endonuclease subunit S [Bacteroidales bacterium]
MITNNFKNSELGPIPNDWDVKTLGEICVKITDGSHESPKESKTGYYMPSVKDMTSMGFDFSDCKKISQDDYNRLCRNGCKPEIGDVLIAKDGSILKYCFCVENDLPIVILSSIAIIKPDKSISGTYLAHYFSQKEFVASVIANNKTGTGVPRIVLRNFEKILVAFPKELPEQRRIAAALSDIDALIENLDALIDKKWLI